MKHIALPISIIVVGLLLIVGVFAGAPSYAASSQASSVPAAYPSYPEPYPAGNDSYLPLIMRAYIAPKQ